MEDYTTAGFDKLLSRGDTPNLGGSLDTPTTSNNAVPFDRTQVTGPLGDIARFGKVQLQGPHNRLVVNDDNNLRVVIGEQEDGNQGIIVSKEGKDANVLRPADLIFNSSQNVFKIISINTAFTPNVGATAAPGAFGNNGATNTYPHGLTFTPTVMGFLNTGGRYYPLNTSDLLFDGVGYVWRSFLIAVDAINVYITSQITVYGTTQSGAGTASIKYYLLQETLS